MVEYQRKTSSGVAKAGLATAAATAGVVLLSGGVPAVNSGLFAGRAPFGAPVAANCGYVTDKDMSLIREIGAKDSQIAQLTAEKYADTVVKEYARTEVEPLKTRVCELETAAAVNAVRDRDFRRYVDAEFVHQPKAKMRQSIVVCKQCGCHCCECDSEGA